MKSLIKIARSNFLVSFILFLNFSAITLYYWIKNDYGVISQVGFGLSLVFMLLAVPLDTPTDTEKKE